MVKELLKGNVRLYICEACGLTFKEVEWAQKCQEWCQQHHSCNLKIMEHAVPLE